MQRLTLRNDHVKPPSINLRKPYQKLSRQLLYGEINSVFRQVHILFKSSKRSIMVKRIKKRVPKSNKEEVVQEAIGSAVEGNVVEETEVITDDAPLDASEALKIEIAQNAHNASADRFSEVMEGVLLGLAENWVSVLMVLGVGIGIYGFKQYSDSSAQTAKAEYRGQLEKVMSSYQALQDQKVSVFKQKANASEANILGLSTDAASEAEAPKADAYKAVSQELGKLKVMSQSGPLLKLAKASALFDAAQSAADFENAAKLYGEVASNSEVEPIAQSLAAQNAAIAYEEAANLATDKKAMWAKAADAWAQMGKIDPKLFDLKASVNRARVLRTAGDLAGARKIYEGMKMLYAKELQETQNRGINQQIKLGMALTASAKVTEKK